MAGAGAMHLLRRLGTYCSPLGVDADVVDASKTILQCVDKGLVVRDGRRITLTAAGVNTLMATGWRPGENEDGCACPCHVLNFKHDQPCCERKP